MTSAPDSSVPQSSPPPASPEKPAAKQLDFEKLDLTVEEVEERISPSETNVFDK